MQTISTAAGTDLMAAWRASGGALEAGPAGYAGDTPAASGAAGDDGLTATAQTVFIPCSGDDGLTANRVTSPAGGCPPFADDGLLAGNATRPPECWGVALADEGLLAGGAPTRPPECWGVAAMADDGLSASNASPTYPGFCWDRR